MLWQIVSKEHDAWPPTNPTDLKAAFDVPEPTMRAGHSVTALPDGRLLVFGGFDGYKPLNDCYLYQPEFGTWAQILRGPESESVLAPQAADAEWPAPLCYHTATLFVEQEDTGKGGVWRVIVYGGRGRSDFSTTLYQLTIYGNTHKGNPRARSSTPDDLRRARYAQSEDGQRITKLYTREAPRLRCPPTHTCAHARARTHTHTHTQFPLLPPNGARSSARRAQVGGRLILGRRAAARALPRACSNPP